MNLPPIGWPVQWFSHAETQRGAIAGVVVGHTGNLLVIETTDQHGRHQIRNSCRHMSDDWLKQHLEWRLDYGAWDHIPGFILPPDTQETPVKQASTTLGSAEPNLLEPETAGTSSHSVPSSEEAPEDDPKVVRDLKKIKKTDASSRHGGPLRQKEEFLPEAVNS